MDIRRTAIRQCKFRLSLLAEYAQVGDIEPSAEGALEYDLRMR